MPDQYIDLHLHSNASDGTNTPLQVYEYALKAGLAAFALTDHDTLDGFAQVVNLVDQRRIEFIPAVELSGYLKGEDIHLLTYFIDPQHADFLEKLSELKEARKTRAQIMVERLNQLGVGITLAAIIEVAKQSTIGRPHIADALYKNGFTKSYDEAFHKYIGNSGPAYEPKKYISVEEAIDLIHGAGGIAILAHPGILSRDDLLSDLLELGLDGIEAYHTQHDSYMTNHYIQTAKKYGLAYSGGSDCHGQRRGRQLLGTLKVPYRCLTILREVHQARFG